MMDGKVWSLFAIGDEKMINYEGINVSFGDLKHMLTAKPVMSFKENVASAILLA